MYFSRAITSIIINILQLAYYNNIILCLPTHILIFGNYLPIPEFLNNSKISCSNLMLSSKFRLSLSYIFKVKKQYVMKLFYRYTNIKCSKIRIYN